MRGKSNNNGYSSKKKDRMIGYQSKSKRDNKDNNHCEIGRNNRERETERQRGKNGERRERRKRPPGT